MWSVNLEAWQKKGKDESKVFIFSFFKKAEINLWLSPDLQRCRSTESAHAKKRNFHREKGIAAAPRRNDQNTRWYLDVKNRGVRRCSLSHTCNSLHTRGVGTEKQYINYESIVSRRRWVMMWEELA